MKIEIFLLLFVPFILYYNISLFKINYTYICKYTDDRINYYGLICSFQIEKYIAIYDLCYEDYPNFKCFIDIIPHSFIFSIFNNTVIHLRKKNCYYEKCNYIKPIKGSYPIPKYNKKKSLIKLRNTIKSYIKSKKPVNLILGSGKSYNNKVDDISYKWISTDQDTLDVTNRYDITQHLISNTVDNMIAMHVFEHISHYNIFNSFLNIKYLLKPKGKIILCLPDINAHNSPYWRNSTDAINVQPSYGHRVIYSYKALKYIIERIKLKIYSLSYHKENGERIVNQSNFVHFESLDINKYIKYQIEKDTGYSLCVVILK